MSKGGGRLQLVLGLRQRLRGDRRVLAANVVARLGALVALGIATVIVARAGGPSEVGVYALLRVLPGLAGVLVSCGLPGATAFFLAGADGRDPATRPTVAALTLGTGLLAGAAWAALTPLLHRLFFPDTAPALIALAGVAVFTQLLVAVGKSCLQGDHDLAGANRMIFWEEASFLPVYGAMWAGGMHGVPLLIWSLVAADVVVALAAWWRAVRRSPAPYVGRPSRALAVRICSYGLRGQVGGVLSLMNLRLDFTILGAIAGPAVLGTYAIASKYAELLRLPGLAVTYVLYPRYVRDGRASAAAQARRLLRPAWALNLAVAVPLAVAAGWLLPLLYGAQFDAAVVPTYVLLAGLVGESVAGVVTAYLYGAGRPGTNSLAIGVGLLLTAALDVALIPSYGAIGAAVASCIAYLTTTAALLVAFRWLRPTDLPVTPARMVTAP